MELTKLFEVQRKLDAEIEKKHPTVLGEDRLAKRILALQVELGECANEWRGFKFWSTNQISNDTERCMNCAGDGLLQQGKIISGRVMITGPDLPCHFCSGSGRINPLLEEYVDCLHFILSIGNDINFTAFHFIGSYEDTENITEMFLKANEEIVMVSRAHRESAAEESMRLYYSLLFDAFITLGEMLGFTWEQIETAYMQKNEINYQRQETGY